MSSEQNRVDEAKQLRQLEGDLNDYQYNKIMIGQLLVHPFYFIFKNKYKPDAAPKIKRILKACITAILNQKKGFATDKKVFYYSSGDHHHLDQIKLSVQQTFQEKDLFIFGGSKDSHFTRKSVHCIPFLKLLKAQVWYFKNITEIKQVLKRSFTHPGTVNSLLLDLNYQLICSIFWDNFFKSSTSINLLVGDFDRGYESSVIFACVKKYRINSVVIQHGAVSPPYSFTPLIADKVFLWGKMQALQFIEMGANEDQIVITGTPIIKRVTRSLERRSAVLEKHGISRHKKNIVLGITPIKPSYNNILIELFAKLSSHYRDKFNFIVKLHPIHKTDEFMWVKEKHDLILLDKRLSQDEYFNICDILLAHSTGLANESFFHGIHVGILDVLTLSSGNGIELNKYVDVPLLKNYEEVKDFILARADEENAVKNSEVIYANVGEEASSKIKLELSKYIHQ